MSERESTAQQDEQPSRFWQKINLVAEIASLTHNKPPVRETFSGVLELIKTILPYDGASLYLMSDSGDRLKEVASVGDRVDLLSFLTIGSGPGLTGWTAASRKPVLLSNRQLGNEFEPENAFRTIMSVPLLIRETVTGVLNLGCHRAQAYEKKDIKLMTIVASQCAVSIERQFYQREIEQKNQELQAANRRFQQAQQKIIAGEKMQAMIDLATIVNHEINNPLAVIVGNLQCLLVESEIPSQKMLGRLKRIESAALQISDVNRKLLSFNDVPRAVQMVEESDESELCEV